MVLLTIFLPLFTFLYLSLLGLFLGRKGASYLSISILFFCFLSSLNLFFITIFFNRVKYISLGTWINSDILFINWGFILDSLSLVMMVMILSVSLCVHCYSENYMYSDPQILKFFSYLSLFTFFMLILVTSDNFVQLFLGWEGIGICSYLLIGFWYTRIESNKAAVKALVINRFGDIGYLMGIFIIYFYFRTFDFSIVFTLFPYFIDTKINFCYFNLYSIDCICFFLFIGSVGKSAQFGLHTWLPDAMEAPTPVSALIHAATLVTAGVFLLVRCSFIFEIAQDFIFFISIIGIFSTFFAATVAFVQYDIKKIIAYSTCSQLGYMISVCGISGYNAGLFHLINHGFFKSLLFLSAGSIIHAMSGEQDIRKFGGICYILPYSYSVMFVGTLALAGFPFLSGFYSKDMILEISFSNYNFNATFVYWFGLLVALFTVLYSFRLAVLTFFLKTNSYKTVIKNVSESSITIRYPLFFLSIGSVIIGFLLKDAFIGIGSGFWNNSIYVLTDVESEFIPHIYKIIPILFSFSGFIFYLFTSRVLNLINLSLIRNIKFNNFFHFLINSWYFDLIYSYYIALYILVCCYKFCYKILEKGLFDIIGPSGVVFIIYKVSLFFCKKHTGYIYHYVSFMVLGLFTCIFFIVI